MVKQIKAAGGIIIAKTNVPQTMLSFECGNPLWGRTSNPWSADHTCGGSSGGEAAAIAFDASVIGIGSDIGMTIRCIQLSFLIRERWELAYSCTLLWDLLHEAYGQEDQYDWRKV